MLLFLGHLQSYPTPECIRFNERCQVSHIAVIPHGSKFPSTDFVGYEHGCYVAEVSATDNNQLDIEIFLHAQVDRKPPDTNLGAYCQTITTVEKKCIELLSQSSRTNLPNQLS